MVKSSRVKVMVGREKRERKILIVALQGMEALVWREK